MKDDVLAFLAQHTRCVMSTITADGLPEAAMVGFSEAEDLSLLIGTSNKSRKYQNLQHSKNVAIVIGFGTDATVQYEGIVRELDADELAGRLDLHLKKLPGAKDYVKESDQVWLLVTPTWLRFLEHNPPQSREMRDFS